MSDSPPPPRAVDPSIYSAVYPEQPHPKVVEVAELMTELYKLFISMRYINAEDVAFPPHTENPVNITEAARYGLTKDVVDMMQMVPYYTSFPNWNHGSDAGEFIFWGEFHDMRGTDADWYQTVVDPFYALSYCPPDGQTTDTDCPQSFDDENGIYIRPHYAVINRMGNHGSVLIFDTKDYKMWFIAQLGGSVDPAFTGAPIKETRNRNDLAQYPSRPATDLLRDLIDKFRGLEYIPGGLYGNTTWDYHLYKDLYISSGWPSNFNSTAFTTGQTAIEEAESQRYFNEEPLRKVREAEHRATARKQAEERRTETELRLTTTADPREREGLERELQFFVDFEERETKRFAELQQIFRGRLTEYEDRLAQPEAAIDPESRGRMVVDRAELIKDLADLDTGARELRGLAEARKKAEDVDPAVRQAFEERVKQFGY